MKQVTVELQNDIADKFSNLMQVFASNELMFEKFIEYHANKLKQEIASMQEDLDNYEATYNQKSADFYTDFEDGKLGDSEDFIIWSGIYEMQLSCKEKLQKLL